MDGIQRINRRKQWRARYRGPDGKERSRTFRRKLDAERWLTAERARRDLGEWVDPSLRVTFSDWFPRWLQGKRRISDRTRSDYEEIMRSRLAPAFGDWQLGAITRDDTQDFIDGMIDDGLSAGRIRKVHVVLSACLEAAADERLIGRNPAKRLELPRVSDAPRIFLTAEEVAAFAEAFPDPAVVYVLAYGGLRFGELAALRCRHVRDGGRLLDVFEAQTTVGGVAQIGETKTHRRRTVRLPHFVATNLTDHLDGQPGYPDGLVFTATKGGMLHYSPFRRWVWNPARDRTRQIPADTTPHDLRHTCASLMRHEGATVEAVSQQLGHRSPVVTLSVYSHLFESDLDPVMEGLEASHRAAVVRHRRGTNVISISEVTQQNPR